MEGAVVSPSEEDSQTFSIHFSSGEVYKVRAAMARERQMWVDQLRASSTVTSTQGRRGSCRTRSISMSASSICDLIAKPTTTNVDDTFSLVENVLHSVDDKQREVAKTIESFPLHPGDQPSQPSCHSKNLLLMKATSAATAQCLEAALSMLQDLSVQGCLLGAPASTLHHTSSAKIKNTGN